MWEPVVSPYRLRVSPCSARGSPRSALAVPSLRPRLALGALGPQRVARRPVAAGDSEGKVDRGALRHAVPLCSAAPKVGWLFQSSERLLPRGAARGNPPVMPSEVQVRRACFASHPPPYPDDTWSAWPFCSRSLLVPPLDPEVKCATSQRLSALWRPSACWLGRSGTGWGEEAASGGGPTQSFVIQVSGPAGLEPGHKQRNIRP